MRPAPDRRHHGVGVVLGVVQVEAQPRGPAADRAAHAGAAEARLAYVTPSSQYPLGTVLSMARRLELLAGMLNLKAEIRLG